MSREQAEALPEDLRDWLDRKAAELNTTREDVLTRAVAAYRLVDENHERLSETHADRLDDRIEGLFDRIETLETDLDENVEDLRTRVIQVKQETDEKAPADHEHTELDALSQRIDEQERAVDELDGALSDLEAETNAGFENYESILEYLAETSDDLHERLERLARAVVEARSRLTDLEARGAERDAVAELQSEANRHGTTAARCGSCGARVEIALLSAPRCPHCDVVFRTVEPARGFLGSATLTPGSRPALKGNERTDESPSDLIGEDDHTPVADLFEEDDDE